VAYIVDEPKTESNPLSLAADAVLLSLSNEQTHDRGSSMTAYPPRGLSRAESLSEDRRRVIATRRGGDVMGHEPILERRSTYGYSMETQSSVTMFVLHLSVMDSFCTDYPDAGLALQSALAKEIAATEDRQLPSNTIISRKRETPLISIHGSGRHSLNPIRALKHIYNKRRGKVEVEDVCLNAGKDNQTKPTASFSRNTVALRRSQSDGALLLFVSVELGEKILTAKEI